jgi:hypothetical protein
MAGSSITNLNMFKKLRGEDAYKHVVLATTMCDNLVGPKVSYGVEDRERELLQRNDWWGLMHQRGSAVIRHRGDRPSALEIIDYLLSFRSLVKLQIQKQLVDEERSLEETDAGQEYGKELQKLKAQYGEQLVALERSHKQALIDQEAELAETLRAEREYVEERLDEASRAQQDLKAILEQLAQERAAKFKGYCEKIEAEQEKTAKLVRDREADLKRLEKEQEKGARRSRSTTETVPVGPQGTGNPNQKFGSQA